MWADRAWFGVMTLWLASCSSGGKVAPPSVIGEWRADTDGGSMLLFFNGDGTCGEGSEASTGQSDCMPCTWRYEGGSLYITQNQTNVRNVPITLDDETMTVPDCCGFPDLVYRRVNSLAENHCP